MWERSFVAMSVLVGRRLDDTLASLTDESRARTADLARELADAKRSVRARALARVAEEVARATQEAALR